MTAALFAVFAGVGALIRWRANAKWGRLGTLILNLAGAFGLGLISDLDGPAFTVLGTAGIGAMTTVSGVAREVHFLGSFSKTRAAIYLTGTLIAGVGAAWLGVRWGL
ncbi:MAG TPA: hypothetical protein DCL16_09600 [Acidimicrobiaceae bacterium]|nr:hypothetical protein [Acidimicrobiaceae bacterium]|tara:strand:- start:25 stop:345 length:321 start_codon:yes stop_codon:yes gene_type:complete